ncbi:MAG: DUF1295 domain-containing protein [Bacteroidota bacterium]
MNFIVDVAIVIWFYMTIVFLLAVLKEDNSIVDFFWGLGFILVAFYSMVSCHNLTLHNSLLNLMILTWGVRLSFHIFIRNHGKPEDFRYKAWRDTWKWFRLRSYFQIFMLQGFLMLIISAPIYLSNVQDQSKFGLSDAFGMILFLIGFGFEWLGDHQLAKFRSNPLNKGKIITVGLWRWTRHPNYFGEALLWLGIGVFAFSAGSWYVFISPLILTLLLRFVSGVPMLEKKYEGRGDWAEYCKKTAPFVPFVHFL